MYRYVRKAISQPRLPEPSKGPPQVELACHVGCVPVLLVASCRLLLHVSGPRSSWGAGMPVSDSPASKSHQQTRFPTQQQRSINQHAHIRSNSSSHGGVKRPLLKEEFCRDTAEANSHYKPASQPCITTLQVEGTRDVHTQELGAHMLVLQPLLISHTAHCPVAALSSLLPLRFPACCATNSHQHA